LGYAVIDGLSIIFALSHGADITVQAPPETATNPAAQKTAWNLSVSSCVGCTGCCYFLFQSRRRAVCQSLTTAGQKFTFCGEGSQRYCVVDGDTIRFAETKIRVEDIDTPEIHDYKCESELERGLRAKSRLLELVNEGPFEIVSNGGDDVDQYGCKLRHLMRNGLSLGELLVDEGLARRYAGGRRSWCL
jgi:hypothetical protein